MAYAGVDKDFYGSYFNGIELAHAIKIKEAKRYKIPQELKNFNVKQDPQSFVYKECRRRHPAFAVL